MTTIGFCPYVLDMAGPARPAIPAETIFLSPEKRKIFLMINPPLFCGYKVPRW
jgi:hypothetical protein